MPFQVDGIVKDYDASDIAVAASATQLASVPLDVTMIGVAVFIKNTGGVNPLTATVTPVDGGVQQTAPAAQTVTVAANGLGVVYLPNSLGQPLPDSVLITATSAAGTNARTRVKAVRGKSIG